MLLLASSSDVILDCSCIMITFMKLKCHNILLLHLIIYSYIKISYQQYTYIFLKKIGEWRNLLLWMNFAPRDFKIKLLPLSWFA
jgi:hypothetical protein